MRPTQRMRESTFEDTSNLQEEHSKLKDRYRHYKRQVTEKSDKIRELQFLLDKARKENERLKNKR